VTLPKQFCFDCTHVADHDILPRTLALGLSFTYDLPIHPLFFFKPLYFFWK
jgi:hypothetical protein